MSEQVPSPTLPVAGQDPVDRARRKHFVHVYAVVRVKVEVHAENHRAAMAAADERLFGNGFAVSLNPRGNGVIEADYAEEVVGYLVDEVDDPDYERTRNYGPDHQLQTLDEGRRRLPAACLQDQRVTLTFVPQIWHGDQLLRSMFRSRQTGPCRGRCFSNGFRQTRTGMPTLRSGMTCVTKVMLRNGSGTGPAPLKYGWTMTLRTSGVAPMNNEGLLRRRRAHPDLFGDGDERSRRVTRLILRCKARLMPEWKVRAERVGLEADRRFWFRTL